MYKDSATSWYYVILLNSEQDRELKIADTLHNS